MGGGSPSLTIGRGTGRNRPNEADELAEETWLADTAGSKYASGRGIGKNGSALQDVYEAACFEHCSEIWSLLKGDDLFT